MKNNVRERWQQWWFRTAPPHLMAIFRIAFAAFLIVEAIPYLFAVDELFSNHGLVFSLWSHFLPTSSAFIIEPPSPMVAWAVAFLYLLTCVCIMLGWGMRFWLGVLIALYLYYWQLSFHQFPSSYHRIFFFILWVLIFSGADRTFSVRMLRTHGSFFAWEPISIFPQRLLAVQITVTYFGVGWQKIWLPAWQHGDILSRSLIQRWGTPLGRWVVAQNFPYAWYALGVKLTTILECLAPFCLWMPRWRVLFVCFGAFFHIAIAVLMSIWWFVVLIPAYIVFWPPEDIYRLCKRVCPYRIR